MRFVARAGGLKGRCWTWQAGTVVASAPRTGWDQRLGLLRGAAGASNGERPDIKADARGDRIARAGRRRPGGSSREPWELSRRASRKVKKARSGGEERVDFSGIVWLSVLPIRPGPMDGDARVEEAWTEGGRAL